MAAAPEAEVVCKVGSKSSFSTLDGAAAYGSEEPLLLRPNDEPRGATFTDVVKPEGCSFKEPERRDEVVSRPDGCSFNPPDNAPLDEV